MRPCMVNAFGNDFWRSSDSNLFGFGFLFFFFNASNAVSFELVVVVFGNLKVIF